MNPVVMDPKRTLEYGQSHDMARKALPWTLGAIAMGLFMMSEPAGKADEKGWLLGILTIAIALAFLGVLIYRRAQPSVPDLVLSERGILFRSVSEKLIPWDEIRAVKRDKVSAAKDFFSTRVVRLELSPQFYERYMPSPFVDSTVGTGGDPSAIYLAYHLDAPHDELFAAVHLRWRAFSRYGAGAVPVEVRSSHDDRPLAGSAASPTPRRGRVIERASSFEGVRALASLFAGASVGQVIGNLVALALIVALASNVLGYWATDAQVKGRAEAAKWKTWHEERDREQAAFDAEQKKVREKFDRMFKCMNETFDRGPGATRSAECEKE